MLFVSSGVESEAGLKWILCINDADQPHNHETLVL